LGVAALLAPRAALGGSFYDDGTFVFDPRAAARFDFSEPLPDPDDPSEPQPVRVEKADALTGGWVVEVAKHQQLALPLEVPKVARTYRASLWLRGHEAMAFFGVQYPERQGENLDEVAALYPTGRVTSDGWVELANDRLRVDGARATAVVIGAYAPLGTEIDAVELVVDGVIEGVPNPTCDGVGDGSACGVGQVCYWSECRNVNGWVPPIPPDRELVTEYLANRLRFLFGPYIERTLDLPAAEAAIDQMRHASDPWSYWNGYMLAVRRLHDGHTSSAGTATQILRNPKPMGMCFIEGDADLTHGAEPSHPSYLDVLVSHVGADHDLGLRPGDRLVRIDGRHPIDWARSLIEVNWSQPAVSNHETFAEHASALRSLIPRFAHEIEVIRCDSATSTCGAVEVISIADVPWDPPGTSFDHVACDNRPLRHLADSPADHGGGYYDVYAGVLLESDATERIYGVEWQSLMTQSGSDGMGANMNGAVSMLRSDGARGVIFDHRQGTGGTTAGADTVWRFCVPEGPISAYQARQRAEDEQPSLAEGMEIYQRAVDGGWADVGGTSSPADVPVALLVTEDVSASDWLALGMKGAPRVRIFGPYQTNGAFSTRLMQSYWFGLTMVLASGDTFAPDGRSLNGIGVEPDVVVLPKQSDLLVGVDTVFEAALAWVRQEVGS
jgi:hypothetical protein